MTFKIMLDSGFQKRRPPGRVGRLVRAGAVLVAVTCGGWPFAAAAQQGVFLSGEEVPRAVFPDADRFERRVIPATDDLRRHMSAELDGTMTSMWEPSYVSFTAWRGDTALGRAFLVEEIGKHRPITFVVGVRADGRVSDVAVVAYREAYGGQVRNKRFLAQYRKKDVRDSLRPRRTITNIAGATLSVEAASRAVKKALALASALRSELDGAHVRADAVSR